MEGAFLSGVVACPISISYGEGLTDCVDLRVDGIEGKRADSAVQEYPGRRRDRGRYRRGEIEAVQLDRLHARDCDELIEENFAVGLDQVRGDDVTGDVRRIQAGADELDRVDIVVQNAVIRRRVGDDHLARPVHRDHPLVAGPIDSGDDLAGIVETAAVEVVGVDEIAGNVDLSFLGDRVGHQQVGRNPRREVVRDAGLQHPAGLEKIGPAEQLALVRPRSEPLDRVRGKLMEDSLPGKLRSASTRRSITIVPVASALPKPPSLVRWSSGSGIVRNRRA